MEDNAFVVLRKTIHSKILELHELQRQHVAATGQRYIVSGPLPAPKQDWESKEEQAHVEDLYTELTRLKEFIEKLTTRVLRLKSDNKVLKAQLMEIPDTSERETELEQVVKDVQAQLDKMTRERDVLREDKAVIAEHFLNIAVKDTDFINKLRATVRDLLDAFWDMSPLEYAQSRGLDCMSDKVGEDILSRVRDMLKRKPSLAAGKGE